jgi:hypothetical protein
VTSRIVLLTIDAVEPRVVADFWCAALGWQIAEESDDAVRIAAADESWPTVDIVAVPEPKVVKNRIHFDLRADGGTSADELNRLTGLGARQVDVGQGPDARWWVLSDPEGNEFCLFFRTVQGTQAPVGL